MGRNNINLEEYVNENLPKNGEAADPFYLTSIGYLSELCKMTRRKLRIERVENEYARRSPLQTRIGEVAYMKVNEIGGYERTIKK